MVIHPKKPGNAISEYGIVAGLIIVAMIAVLPLLGESISHLFTESDRNLKGSNTQKLVSMKFGEGGPQVIGHNPNAGTLTAPPGGLESVMSNTTGGGTNVTSVDGLLDRQNMRTQANTIANLAKQAASDPSVDPAMLDLITKLANAGHTVANNLDTAIKTFDSAEYFTTYDAFWRAGDDFNAAQDATITYLLAHPNALPESMKQELPQAITSIKGELALLIADDGPKYDGWDTLMGAQPVHEDSNTICENGGDTGECVK